MCTVSNVGDYWRDDFAQRRWPQIPTDRLYRDKITTKIVIDGVSQQEFDELKKEVQELKKLLKAAKQYDEAMGEPDCEMDEKVELIKKIADAVGVDISEVFGK